MSKQLAWYTQVFPPVLNTFLSRESRFSVITHDFFASSHMMSPQKVVYQVIPVIPNIYIYVYIYGFISGFWRNTILLHPEHQNFVVFWYKRQEPRSSDGKWARLGSQAKVLGAQIGMGRQELAVKVMKHPLILYNPQA